MTTLNTHVAQRMKAARQHTGYTQAELARKIGVTSLTVGRWERGERSPSFTDLARFAHAVNRHPAWFLLRNEQYIVDNNDPSQIRYLHSSQSGYIIEGNE